MAVEHPGAFAVQLGDKVTELAGHLASVLDELDDLMSEHAALYDGQSSETGNDTRGQLQGAKDELDRQRGVVAEAGTAIKEYGERLIAAGQS